LFPIGLRVVQLPYIEEGGAAVALDRAVGLEHRAKLAAIHVGEHTLLELLEAWLNAGHQLGAAVTHRAELRAELARERVDAGTLDLEAGRGLWIQAIRGLLWALEADEALAPLAERVHAALEEAAATSLRRRGEGETDELGETDGGAGMLQKCHWPTRESVGGMARQARRASSIQRLAGARADASALRGAGAGFTAVTVFVVGDQ
jgi:hypothetical protein